LLARRHLEMKGNWDDKVVMQFRESNNVDCLLLPLRAGGSVRTNHALSARVPSRPQATNTCCSGWNPPYHSEYIWQRT
jgi:hypothetical protein